VYCTSLYSGWAVYDLAGVSARSAGLLSEVTAWSLLFASALNGRVELRQLADFNRALRREFADRIGRIPADRDLHRMAEDEIAAVVHACQFGFDGAWAPRITKLGALYRPLRSRCWTAMSGWRLATSARISVLGRSASV
jgi:hypothetical protein